MITTIKEEVREVINTAFDWHSGQSSPFYSFASTRIVHNEGHREQLLDELKEIRFHVKIPQDLADLASLEAVIHHAQLGHEVISYEDWLGS